MKQANAEQIAEFEARAAQLSKRSGDLGFIEELDVELVVRPLSVGEYKEYVNGALAEETRTNAETLAFYRATMFPSRAEVTAVRTAMPGIVKRVLDTVEEMAGKLNAEWIPFTADVTDEQLDEYGIPHDVAADLRTRFHFRRQLWILRVTDTRGEEPVTIFTAAVRRLGIEPHNALRAKIKEEDAAYDAAFGAAMDGVLWPSEDERRRAFRAWPALPFNVVLPQLLRLMKGEEEAAGKGRVRRGKPVVG